MAEFLQENAVHAVKERFRRCRQVFQDAQPQGLVRKEQGFPPVKGGNGDSGMFADCLHAGPVQEVIPQHQEDEP